MNAIDNILTSGHHFSEDENLLKFRFSFLNGIMVVVLFFTLINYTASFLGIIDAGRTFENAILIFFVFGICFFCLLRKHKSYYRYVVSFFILSSILLFYFVLLTRPEDEFRLIAFFLGLFATFLLLGKKYGVALSLFITLSIVILSKQYELHISSIAYSSFFTFFICFTAILYFFLQKVENDAKEFQLLNNKLEDKMKSEVQQRQEQELMLLRQTRMTSMGEMLDSIAHQWRQPLMHINSILMNMDHALENQNTDKKYLTNKIDELANLTTHMSQTIEDFRGLFKLENEQVHFSIKTVIEDVLALMKNRFTNIAVKYEAEQDTQIIGHKSEMIQVIIILLSNAVDALDKQSTPKKHIIINTNVTQDSRVITIEDNAGGIISENLTNIFDPYFTTKEQTGGTGLGLYIAKIIVEHKMNGEITVSNTHHGAKFSISLNS